MLDVLNKKLPREALACTLHDLKLSIPIRIFCKDYADTVLDEGDTDWLDQCLDRQELKSGVMYVWLEQQAARPEYDSTFEHKPLAAFARFATWSEEQLLEAIAALQN